MYRVRNSRGATSLDTARCGPSFLVNVSGAWPALFTSAPFFLAPRRIASLTEPLPSASSPLAEAERYQKRGNTMVICCAEGARGLALAHDTLRRA